MTVHDWLVRMRAFSSRPAIIYQEKVYDYAWLSSRVDFYVYSLSQSGVRSGSVVQLVTDYQPEALAIFLALLELSCTVMPLMPMPEDQLQEYTEIVAPEFCIQLSEVGHVQFTSTGRYSHHALIAKLRQKPEPGLIIMSSGSSGKSKAIVHRFLPLLNRVSETKKTLTVLSFLLFDHIGGINTVLNAFYNGNALAIPSGRSPVDIASCLQDAAVNVFITSPSFLNLMLLQGQLQAERFPALAQVNYGSEVMPQSLLERLHEVLPQTKWIQAYGLSELGVIRTRSDQRDSTHLRITDKDVQFRIRDGLLEILSPASMLGYLNAPSPFTDDGWFMTGDAVEVDGDTLRILGRDSDLINVGGEKVYPAEIEDVLMEMPEVEDVVVTGQPNAILGQVVVAQFKLHQPVDKAAFKQQVRKFCATRLPAFKIPQKMRFVDTIHYGQRFKKNRRKVA